MLKEHNNRIFAGIILKLASILVRFIFLVIYVPVLPEGVFTDYFFYLTISLLITYFISFGIADQLPIEINNKKNINLNFLKVLSILLSLFPIIIFPFYFITDSIWLIVLCLVMVFLSGSFIGGISRAYNPFLYDIYLNVPWVIAIILILFIKPLTAGEILILVGGSRWVIQLFIFISAELHKGINFRMSFHSGLDIVSLAKRGWPKSISIFFQLLYIRSPALIAKYYGDASVSDVISMSISILEALWQLFMVVVHRNYIKYLRIKGSDKLKLVFLKDTVFLFFLFLLIMPAWFIIYQVNLIYDVSWLRMFNEYVYFLYANLMLASVLVFNNIRYFLWAKQIQIKVLFFELILLVSQWIVFYFFPDGYYLGISLITFAVCGFVFIYVYKMNEHNLMTYSR